jgi:hypothetical protein
MTSGEDFEKPHARIRIRFSLLALLIFITLACLLLAYFAQPRRVVVTTLFQVSSSAPLSIDANQPRTLGEREYDILKKTQLALLKSNFVLTAAIRNPAIASLPFFQGNQDPVEWLQKNLVVEFPDNAEILSITLPGTKSQQQDLVQIVNAVAKAYQEAVVDSRRQRRLSNRDLLARNLQNLNQEIARKMEELFEIARESGRTDHDSGQVLQKLEMKRLERLDEEIIRLESSVAIGENGGDTKSKSIKERIEQLRDQQSALQKKVVARAGKSAVLETRKRELDTLQRISDEMSTQLQRLDLEASAPDQIQLVQPAAITPQ